MKVNRSYIWTGGALVAVLLIFLWRSAESEPPSAATPVISTEMDKAEILASTVPERHPLARNHFHPEECAACPDVDLEAMKRREINPTDQEQQDRECDDLIREAAAAGNPSPDTSHLGGCEGLTPLHMATTTEQIQSLLDAGADINAPDQYGHTPLFSQAIRGIAMPSEEKLSIVKNLLESGADVRLEDKWGRTAFDSVRMMDTTGSMHLRSIRYVEDQAAAQNISVAEYLHANPRQKMRMDSWPERYLAVAKIKEALLQALVEQSKPRH